MDNNGYSTYLPFDSPAHTCSMTRNYADLDVTSTNMGATPPYSATFHGQGLGTMGSNNYCEHKLQYLTSYLPLSTEPVDYRGGNSSYEWRATGSIPVTEQVTTTLNIGGKIVVGQSLPVNSTIPSYRMPVDVVQSDQGITPRKKLKSKASVKREPKFTCESADCDGVTFTTKYRYNTHVNRFHTPKEKQKQYQCDNCGLYTTCYSTDLTRHEKSCAKP
ncbi:hypothetical protein HYPSUDRAFT_1044135 [Hypholoma sublateritium FD-334 SS-4]|uniref:Uncharacterized protein n=1 Tax=Hypholoma sublateritium (strain FD-334 SS-4) TaxID=945553 RepID=A0A0D2M1T7_HYPSF|nr:hypothetical protein HYPSUDRAFT_1044135 [Hypholoma sublateritium FD-334 SS-4]